MIEIDAERSGPNQERARQLSGKIGRDDVKHATMTTPYGVTPGTIYEKLLVSDLIKSCKNPEKCARYLAKLLVECIPQIAVKAGEIMKWMRQIARQLAKANRGMMWTTPSGLVLVVLHESREPKTIRIRTFDRSLVLYEEDEKRKISGRKQADGVVAHFVHSMDAAHMVPTVNSLHAKGLRHFAMVHDSYGVHAADVHLLHSVLREEFVRIYDEPVLQNFLDELRKANPDIMLPDPPKTGDLDIRQVLASPYFFAGLRPRLNNADLRVRMCCGGCHFIRE